MDTKKFTIGTLVGGIAFFLLGYLFYGLALAGFFKDHANPSSPMRAMADIIWWALILGNLAGAALITWVILKMGNVNSFGGGARIGLVLGFYISLARNLVQYATSNTMDMTGLLVDVVIGAIMAAIVGGIIAVVIGGQKKVA
jgi:hypothetical protein